MVGVALVDADGEAVDYAGRVAPFDIRVAAAEWRIVLALLGRCDFEPWRLTRQLMVRGEHKSFAAVLLPEGYALVMQLLPRCFRVSRRALAEAVREICEDAGLPGVDPTAPRWVRVEVKEASARSRRPRSVWVDRKWRQVEVLGRLAGSELASTELGYRVRLPSGAEITLVREPLGQWFAEPSQLLA